MESKWTPVGVEYPFDTLTDMVHDVNTYYSSEGYTAILETNNLSGESRVTIERDSVEVGVAYDVVGLEELLEEVNEVLSA